MNIPITEDMNHLARVITSHDQASISSANEDTVYFQSPAHDYERKYKPDTVNAMLRLAASAITNQPQIDGELERWREIGRRLAQAKGMVAMQCGGGSVLIKGFDCTDDAEELISLIVNQSVECANPDATSPTPATGKVEVDAEYLVKMEALARCLSGGKDVGSVWKAGPYVACKGDVITVSARTAIIVNEALSSYRAAHPPAAPKSPGDEALEWMRKHREWLHTGVAPDDRALELDGILARADAAQP